MKNSTELYDAITAALNSKEDKLLTGLHAKCTSKFLEQAEKIIKDNNLSETMKMTRMSIMLEGFVAYLVQFGFDHELINRVIKLRAARWVNSGNLPSNAFMQTFKSNINNTTLFFAAVDGLLTPDLAKQNNLTFEDVLPWEISELTEMKEEKSELIIAQKYDDSSRMAPIITGSHFSPALNSTGGFILSRLDKYTEAFVKCVLQKGGTGVNIGTGYGIPERLALLLGAEKIICNDISKEQLDLIAKLTPAQFKERLELMPGSFPDEIKLEDNSVQVLGMFRVLHFCDPETLVKTIKAAHRVLEPGGAFILSAETPLLGNWKKFIPEYEQNVKMGNPWPGFIADTSKYETAGFSKKLPPSMHFLDVAVLTRVLTENGFKVESCTTLNRADSFPKEILLSGEESVGAIARKIMEPA